MKKLILMVMIGIISLGAISCQNKKDEQLKENEKPIEEKVSSQEDSSNNETETEEYGNYSDQLKKDIDELLPEIATDMRELLAKNSKKIDPQFDMEKMQILLFSNITHRAYLINSQNEKFGKPEENIEYSTDTFSNKEMFTTMFNITQFNDKPTYLFNIDLFAYSEIPKELLKKEIEKSIIHEAIHLVLQPKLEKDFKTVEEVMGGSRSIEYPLESESRLYRIQQANYYKKALEAETEKDKIDFIKKGNYFYKKYLEVKSTNLSDAEYDKIEGQPRYYEYRGLALLENINQDEKTLEKRTRRLYLDNNYEIDPEMMIGMGKNGEFYTVGSLAFANIYALKQQTEFNFQNPSKYLCDKYGYTEVNLDEKLAQKVKIYYNELNGIIEQRVDKFTNEMKNSDFKTIKIPVLLKYEENSNVTFEDESIKYLYKGKENTLEKASKEIKLGNNRILLKSADVMKENYDVNIEYYYINVPKKDIEIEDNRLTVQLKELQVYGNKFTEKDGVYELEE